MAKSIAIDSLYAERNSLRSLLAEMPPDDILGRMGLESKLEDLESQINEIELFPETLAETVLFLGGDSVEGSRAIDIDLVSEALKKYQVFISAFHASKTQGEPISESGPIPGSDSSAMQLTATPRGSFGFVLKEKEKQTRLVDSSLHRSVEEANALIAATAFESEDEFESAAYDVQPRVLKELGNFLKTLEYYNASIRIVSSDIRVDIPKEIIHAASSRTENISIQEREVVKTGLFLGARKHSRDFNFQPDNEETISGKLAREVQDSTVSLMNMEYQDKRCKAILLKKETIRKESGRTTVRWTLKDIHLSEASDNIGYN